MVMVTHYPKDSSFDHHLMGFVIELQQLTVMALIVDLRYCFINFQLIFNLEDSLRCSSQHCSRCLMGFVVVVVSLRLRFIGGHLLYEQVLQLKELVCSWNNFSELVSCLDCRNV